MFPGGHEKVPTPWPSAPGTKTFKLGYDPKKVSSQMSDAPLEMVEPGNLHASQPSIVRQHVEYYSGSNYSKTGATSADQGNESNRFPIVYDRTDGKRVIVSGHHRAAAALLQSRQFEARVIKE